MYIKKSSRDSTKSVNQGYLWMMEFWVIFNFFLFFILAILGLHGCQIHFPVFSTLLYDPGSVTPIGHIAQLSCPPASGWVWPMGVSGRDQKKEGKARETERE